ncbi:MAG: endogenous inhibitor of DNA gyrase (YacG/DUF329 family) [Planctomycetota bacterium]|jgi:endogenous inhibitor of DNA gyrase (YacG/DUF329 family)
MADPLCPICKTALPLIDATVAAALQAHPFFPFCSKRCKLVDLGHWFDGNYRFTRPVEDESELQD